MVSRGRLVYPAIEMLHEGFPNLEEKQFLETATPSQF
jgi:hypothetical protein